METEQKNAILAMWEKLINSMPAEIMYDKLVQYKLLTVQDYDEMNKLSTIPRKNRYIIKAIINCPSEHAFDIFIQALTSIDSITTNELAFSLKEEYQNAMPNNLKQVKTRPISNQDDWNESGTEYLHLYFYLMKLNHYLVQPETFIYPIFTK